MSDTIDRVRQRTRRDWVAGGLSEIAIGYLCLVLGQLFFGGRLTLRAYPRETRPAEAEQP